MNKTFLGLAIAVVVAAGAGYGVYSSMSTNAASSEESAVQAEPAELSQTEQKPAPADEANTAAATEPAAAPVTETASADNPVVAIVNDQKITRQDVLDFVSSLPPQMQKLPPETIFPMVQEQVVNAAIVDQKAQKAGIANTPEVEEQMGKAKTQIIRAVFAEKEIDANYNESETQKAYDQMVAEMPKVDEVKASHILVDDEAKAKEIITKLDGGAKFADLAKEYSKDKSNAQNGGDLGYFAQGDMVKEFGDAAFALAKGKYTQTPVKTQFGYHVILLEDKRARPAPAFDDVKDELSAKVKRDLLNKMMEEWRSSAKVERFDFNGQPYPEEKKTN
ncbi:MAG: peptidylprolyl isomerase [Pseudobdellovibrionaceae bacterium]|nr:peptidylprolyl isomerase [Pseudobdellovibrionaceae bacterium]